jgi:two-component system, cell cycle sensor histidine kinase and response regulator CckA
LDVLMPKRNGRQVFDNLRAQHPEIPVLFCSGYSAEMLPPEIAPEDGFALINKPYSARELLTQVHRLLKA